VQLAPRQRQGRLCDHTRTYTHTLDDFEESIQLRLQCSLHQIEQEQNQATRRQISPANELPLGESMSLRKIS